MTKVSLELDDVPSSHLTATQPAFFSDSAALVLASVLNVGMTLSLKVSQVSTTHLGMHMDSSVELAPPPPPVNLQNQNCCQKVVFLDPDGAGGVGVSVIPKAVCVCVCASEFVLICTLVCRVCLAKNSSEPVLFL